MTCWHKLELTGKMIGHNHCTHVTERSDMYLIQPGESAPWHTGSSSADLLEQRASITPITTSFHPPACGPWWWCPAQEQYYRMHTCARHYKKHSAKGLHDVDFFSLLTTYHFMINIWIVHPTAKDRKTNVSTFSGLRVVGEESQLQKLSWMVDFYVILIYSKQ